MKKSAGFVLALAGFVVAGGISGAFGNKNAQAAHPAFNLPRIENALSDNALTAQPSEFPDTAAAMAPFPSIQKSGQTDSSGTLIEGQPTTLFGDGTSLLVTESATPGNAAVYAAGSSTPLECDYGVVTSNPAIYYKVHNSFADQCFWKAGASTGVRIHGGKLPKLTTSGGTTYNNVLTGDTSITMTGGRAFWLIAGGYTETTGKGVINISGGTIQSLMGDYGQNLTSVPTAPHVDLTGGATINISGNAHINGAYGTVQGNTSVVMNIEGQPYVKILTLTNIKDNILQVTGLLDKKAKIGLTPNVTSGSSIPDSTMVLAHASDASYLANYRSIFSFTSAYKGTVGEFILKGNDLVYTYPETAVTAPTPTSTYSKGTFSGLVAGETYLLTDSDGTVHTITADSNGTIAVNKTTNTDLIDTTISSIVQVRNANQTADSAAQSVTDTMPATLATPSVTYANETLSGLVAGYDYTFTFSDGTSTTIPAGAHDTTLSLLGWSAFYNKTITGIVRNSSSGDEIDSLPQSVSLAVPDRYATPSTTFNEGVIASLTPSTSYRLTYIDSNGTAQTKTISSTSDGTYVTYKDSDLAGAKISGITQIGDNGGLTSTTAVVSYKVPSQYAIVAPTYDATTHILSGLSAESTYIVTDSTGATHEISTGDSTSVSLAEHPELAGLTITSVQQKGDGTTTITSDKQASSLNYAMPTRRKDDGSLASLASTSYDQPTDTLQGLTASTRYVVTAQDGTSVIVTSGSDGKVDLSTYSELVGKTITSVALKGTNADGDNTDYCDSLSVATSYKVLPHEAVGTPSYDPSTIALTGLTPNVAYVLTDSNGTTYTATTDKNGKLDLASLTDASGKAISGGAKLVSLVAKGDQTSTIDSYSTSLTTPITLPSREKTPSTSYESDIGLLAGLDSGADYQLTYTKTDGTLGTLRIHSTSSGMANILDYPELENSTITGVQKLPTSSGMMISAAEKTAYVVRSGAEILTSKKDYVKKRIATAYAQAIANSSVTDKDALTKALADVLSRYDKAVDDLAYTDQPSFATDTDALVKKAEEECAYEIKKETAIEEVEDLKRSCADDEKVNAVIAVYKKKLSDLQFGKDPESAMSDLVSEAKKAVELQTTKSAAETTMSGGSTEGMTGEEKALYDTYVSKIDAATSESEVASLLAEYQSSLADLKAKEVATTEKNYAIFGYVVLGLYVLFYAVYFGILRHHHVDGIYVIAWAVEFILLITVSLLVKGTNPLVLALLWGFYAVSIPLPFLFKNKDKDHQNPEKKAEAK
jgi:hypothetical protein